MPVLDNDNIVVGDNGEEVGKTLIRYYNDTLRPNIHISVYYPIFAKEYNLLINCNILIKEDIHR